MPYKIGQNVYFIDDIVFAFQRNTVLILKGFICGYHKNIDGTMMYSIIQPIETEFAATSVSHTVSEVNVFLHKKDAEKRYFEIMGEFQNDKNH